jgi:hypothetical protein
MSDHQKDLFDYFKGQVDAYERPNEKKCLCGCTYRCSAKFIGIFNVVLLMGYIARCIVAESYLSANLTAH